jgi:hypothetical protein
LWFRAIETIERYADGSVADSELDVVNKETARYRFDAWAWEAIQHCCCFPDSWPVHVGVERAVLAAAIAVADLTVPEMVGDKAFVTAPTADLADSPYRNLGLWKMSEEHIWDTLYPGLYHLQHFSAWVQARKAEWTEQCALLDDIFGNPFRPVAFDAAWRTPTVAAIARAIYQERRFADLPILADALEESGCSHSEILAHLRSGGDHVRGCWPLDLVLEKS